MRQWVTQLYHGLHRNLLWLLILTNGLAIFAPGFGQAIRKLSVGTFHWGPESLVLSAPVLMLWMLLFNAGIGMRTRDLVHLGKRPTPLISALLVNILLPVIFIGLTFLCLRDWHNPDEWGNLLMGLTLVAAMPIAGASTAWSQNVNGDLALSLGLVLISTLLSPITTPMVMHLISLLAHGDYREDLQELAVQGTSLFLFVAVILPSLVGMAAHWLLGEERVKVAQPYMKLLNLLTLLLLSYSNAALSLPQAFIHFDPDYMAIIIVFSVLLCICAFACGAGLAKLLKVAPGEKAALMFGLGMNNNGTGLVLSSIALADHPLVMLPIIFYNLAQQIGAAIVDRWLNRDNGADE